MDVVCLPHQTTLSFVAEGAANIVYRLSFPPNSPSISSEVYSDSEQYGPGTPPPTEIDVPSKLDPSLDGKLLRLRKDLPTATSILDAQKAYVNCVRPLFGAGDIVHQRLVELPDGIIEDCNAELTRMELSGERPTKRHGTYLSKEVNFGLLVTDMSPHQDEDVVTFEFKPKWLAQSPNAPAGSKRCRTCALRAMRRAEQLSTKGKEREERSADAFCPLDLVSKQKSRISAAAERILDSFDDARVGSAWVKSRLFEELDQVVGRYNEPFMAHLKSLQTQLDPAGILADGADIQNLLLAMTLRDCTLFVKVSFVLTKVSRRC